MVLFRGWPQEAGAKDQDGRRPSREGGKASIWGCYQGCAMSSGGSILPVPLRSRLYRVPSSVVPEGWKVGHLSSSLHSLAGWPLLLTASTVPVLSDCAQARRAPSSPGGPHRKQKGRLHPLEIEHCRQKVSLSPPRALPCS